MSSPVIVAVAGNPAEAQIWVDALRHDGIEAGTYERGSGAAFGGGRIVTSDYPVLVAPDSIGDARNVIAELGGAGQLSPIEDDSQGSIASWLLLPGALLLGMVLFVAFMYIIAK